jgi:small subunit ribosomal protein S1
LTAERVEEQTADQPAATSTDTAAEAAETPNAQAADVSQEQETTSPAGQATESEPTAEAQLATEDESAADTQPAAEADSATDAVSAAEVDSATDAPPAAEAGVDAEPADGATPVGTSAPSPEAAIGASAARPLGDAEEMAVKADDAVERMVEQQADQDARVDDAAAADTDAATATASDAAVEAESPEGQAPTTDDAPAQAAVESAAPPAVERRPVPEGPEPTTMEELLNEQPGEIRSLKHGDVVEGNVVRIDKDEILVDIGAKSEGVVSNRELYGRNAESQPQLNIGDTVLVYVLQPESPEGHAVLSLRRAGLERKWRAMQEQLDAGTIIEAPVIDHNKGGLIVDCGIRGFVPISQIVDFPRRPQNEQPRDAAQEIAEKLQPYVGRKLRLKILEVNRKANRLILSEKVALYEERREKRDELFSSLQVGQKVTGTVRSIAPFGVFIDLGGIDGLVHKSELSWNKVNNPEAGYKIGEEVEAEVIDINHERGRISLSIRRLQPDPWHSSVADMKVNDVIDGAVTKIVNFGAFVRVRDGLEGLIHISELSHQRVVHPGDVVHEGQRLKLKVISLDSERHRLGLSLKQAEEEPAQRPERERRPRQERGAGYDASKAVQEPEGGIDNTLAAAFAQVRQQIQETEAARDTDDQAEAVAEPGADDQAEAVAEPGADDQAEAVAEPAADDQAEAVVEAAEEPKPGDVTVAPGEAPALEVGAAAGGESEETTAGGAEEAAEPATEEPAEPAAAQAEPTAQAADSAAAADDASSGEASQAEGDPAATSADGADKEDASLPATPATPARKGRSKKAGSAGANSGAPVADTSAEPAEGSPDAAPAEGGDTEPAKG